jgi:hypothetical protein
LADGDGADFQSHAEALLEQTVGFGEVPDQAGTHRAATDQPNAHMVHPLI